MAELVVGNICQFTGYALTADDYAVKKICICHGDMHYMHMSHQCDAMFPKTGLNGETSCNKIAGICNHGYKGSQCPYHGFWMRTYNRNRIMTGVGMTRCQNPAEHKTYDEEFEFGLVCQYWHDGYCPDLLAECRFGDNCNRQDCKFGHPRDFPYDGYLPLGTSCTMPFQCNYKHFKHYPKCNRKVCDTDCRFKHDTKESSTFSTNVKKGFSIKCRWNLNCRSANCKFQHDAS